MASNSNSTAATSINRGVITTSANINANINSNNESSSGNAASSSISIEDLYKYFGILADAKDQAGDVSKSNQ